MTDWELIHKYKVSVERILSHSFHANQLIKYTKIINEEVIEIYSKFFYTHWN